ncbi:hypothetical protein CFC21_109905, partial [Triticum aestivum]
QSFNPR